MAQRQPAPRADALAGLNLTGLLTGGRAEADALGALVTRATARARQFHPVTAQERLATFDRLKFRPHGVYLPHDAAARSAVQLRLRAIGEIDDDDGRRRAYFALQDETAGWQQQGVAGVWTGQQAVARSEARFRLAACGRRFGKTALAAREAIAVALLKPQATVWLAAPINKLVERPFEEVLRCLEANQIDARVRNSKDDRRISFQNGSVIEGVSLENILSAAGAAVDFAVIDEAAQIEADAWHRAILPPLADKKGQALLISSYEGDEGFFAEQARRSEKWGDTETWFVFSGRSWENFYAFPQARESDTIRDAKRQMDPLDFMEQFGAIPAHVRNLVFPQFKRRVHVGDYPVDPTHPIILAVDPSGGANQYAVLAIQDYGDTFYARWEYYVSHVITEEVIAAVGRQPWVGQVTEVICDSAYPAEIERWVRAGYDAFGVPDKPEPWERYPISAAMLRDPARYLAFHEEKLAVLLIDHHLTRAEFEALDPLDAHPILVELEEALADPQLTDDDVAALQSCAHFFVDQSCTHFVEEVTRYTYQPKKQRNLSLPEVGRKWRDHLMDAWGYYCWFYKRWDVADAPAPTASYVRQDHPLGTAKLSVARPPQEWVTPPPPPRETPGALLLQAMRSLGDPGARRAHSYVVRQ